MPDLVSALMNVPLTKTVTQTSSTTVSLEHILKVVSTDIELLELKILNDVKTDIPLLNNVADHILSSGGKRLRPALVLLGAEMFDGVDERVMQAAQVIEYLHTATLLHDDVVDGLGDGPVGAGLPKPPADLIVHVPLHSDTILFEFIRDGIGQSGMPGQDGVLTEDEMWHLVNYLRAEFDNR